MICGPHFLSVQQGEESAKALYTIIKNISTVEASHQLNCDFQLVFDLVPVTSLQYGHGTCGTLATLQL